MYYDVTVRRENDRRYSVYDERHGKLLAVVGSDNQRGPRRWWAQVASGAPMPAERIGYLLEDATRPDALASAVDFAHDHLEAVDWGEIEAVQREAAGEELA